MGLLALAPAPFQGATLCALSPGVKPCPFRCRANTVGLLALLANCLSFAAYLCVLQQFLARRPHPFSAFLAASVVGGAGIAALAAPDFKTVRFIHTLFELHTFFAVSGGGDRGPGGARLPDGEKLMLCSTQWRRHRNPGGALLQHCECFTLCFSASYLVASTCALVTSFASADHRGVSCQTSGCGRNRGCGSMGVLPCLQRWAPAWHMLPRWWPVAATVSLLALPLGSRAAA